MVVSGKDPVGGVRCVGCVRADEFQHSRRKL